MLYAIICRTYCTAAISPSRPSRKYLQSWIKCLTLSFYTFIKNLQLTCCSPHGSNAQIKHLEASRAYPDYAILQSPRIPVIFFNAFSKLTIGRVRFWAQPKWSTNICTPRRPTIIYFSKIFRIGWIFAVPSPYLLRGYNHFMIIAFSAEAALKVKWILKPLS